jgi:hypothetical protein
VLYNHGASLVLSGHDHDYERFAPQDPSGRFDRSRGIRQFIVGTGGATLGSFAGVAPNSEVRNNRAYGVLQLTLRPDGYDWRFVATEGDSFTDAGSDTCRGTAPAATAPPPTVEPATPPAEPDAAAAPSPSDSQTSSPSATNVPANPPTTGRRRSTPATTSRAPASPRAAAGSAKPPATRPPASAASAMTTHTQLAPVAPILAPAPDAPPAETADSSVPTATASAIRGYSQPAGEPGYSEPAGDPGESTPLALAISGLIDRSSPSPASDRRSIALLAVALLVADGAGIAALRRRGGRSRLSFGRR